MADPSPYVVSYNFSDFQSNNPMTPLPAPKLDNELANIAAAIATAEAAIRDVRDSDGTLKNGSVTFDSLALAVQLMLDPSNATLVANAVATAQAAQAAASGSASVAAASAANALTQAINAAASASNVNLTLFLPKAGNLAGIGSPDTARANLNAAKVDGSDMVGRLAPHIGGYTVVDFNAATTSGWYAADTTGPAINGPPGSSGWLLQVVSFSAIWNMQIAYPVLTLAATGASAVTPYRRFSFDSGGGVIAWTAWESTGPVPVGSTIWINGTTAPPGFVKENGALLSRAQFPALFAYANASGNIVSEASWFAGNSGAFSTGDLATAFRIPDSRGEFIRGYDDGRGVDSGRVLGAHQADLLRDHTHTLSVPTIAGGNNNNGGGGGAFAAMSSTTSTGTTSGASIGGAETRPRNNAKLACIKF